MTRLPDSSNPDVPSLERAITEVAERVNRVIALDADDRWAAALVEAQVRNNDDVILVLCEHVQGEWVLAGYSGGFDGEVDLWVSSDPDQPGEEGIGMYCRRLTPQRGIAVVNTGGFSRTVPFAEHWVLVVDRAVECDDWSPILVEVL